MAKYKIVNWDTLKSSFKSSNPNQKRAYLVVERATRFTRPNSAFYFDATARRAIVNGLARDVKIKPGCTVVVDFATGDILEIIPATKGSTSW